MPSHKTTLRQFIEAVWNQGNVAAVEEYLAPSYIIHHDPGDPWHGQTLNIDGFKQRLVQSRAPFPDQCFAIEALIEEGDQVVMTWQWTATHQGDLPGFPATGKPIAMSGATVYSFTEEGRLSGHWQITDRLSVYQQLQQAQAGS